MDGITILLFGALLVFTWFYFIKYDKKRAIINKFPGPKSYPIIGTTLSLMFMNKPGKLNYTFI